jgi:hypothetical protein
MANSEAAISGSSINIGAHNLVLQGGTSIVNGGGNTDSASATIQSSGALNITLSGSAILNGGSATVSGAGSSEESTALALLEGDNVLFNVVGSTTITGGNAFANSGASTGSDYGADASADLISQSAFAPQVGGNLILSGGASTATAAAKAKAQGLLQATSFDITVGGNFNIDNSAATAHASGSATATSSALLSSTGTKDITVGGAWNIIGGSATVSGGVADTIAGTDPGTLLVGVSLVAHVSGPINLTAGHETGGSNADSAATILGSSEIDLFTSHLNLKGNTGSGLFQQIGPSTINRIFGNAYPITVNDGVPNSVTLFEDTSLGDAFILSGAPPQNLDSLQEGILAAIDLSKSSRIVGFLEDANLYKGNSDSDASSKACK